MLLLKKSLVNDLTDVGNLRKALQIAIELEHSTIPPYLYALYSLKPGQNEEIRQLIRSIVWEEMSHMSLACNMLNAIGGSPEIDKPDFIPNYPGPLPGTVESGLIVPLAPFSPQLIHDVFMVIEQPEKPNNYPVNPKMMLATVDEPLTIGMFYEGIAQAFRELGEDIFTGDASRQVSSWRIQPVTNLATALNAIETIVEQGEGTPESPMDQGLMGDEELAHYYRFAEIYNGYRLIPNASAPPNAPFDQRYVYGGAPIAYDPGGVWPVVTNPSSATYTPGSSAQFAAQTFDYTYTGLLKALHMAFNGHPEHINASIGMMESLKGLALGMMSTPYTSDGKANSGPTFRYQPVLPIQYPPATNA
ncbi:ferritin-like domain-containing protein [Dyadobacter sp. MSC1_007]|jgi:rubrerythrin|uniref:ferritin-like domain-containing protein n=1 Tax=Dyadobacter sp. MSC1_007 TaxID=2909264 RepID=UPI00202DDE5B|nr:ferritin-like protein [Dyadobacter sp. MSC1_007]